MFRFLEQSIAIYKVLVFNQLYWGIICIQSAVWGIIYIQLILRINWMSLDKCLELYNHHDNHDTEWFHSPWVFLTSLCSQFPIPAPPNSTKLMWPRKAKLQSIHLLPKCFHTSTSCKFHTINDSLQTEIYRIQNV